MYIVYVLFIFYILYIMWISFSSWLKISCREKNINSYEPLILLHRIYSGNPSCFENHPRATLQAGNERETSWTLILQRCVSRVPAYDGICIKLGISSTSPYFPTNLSAMLQRYFIFWLCNTPLLLFAYFSYMRIYSPLHIYNFFFILYLFDTSSFIYFLFRLF